MMERNTFTDAKVQQRVADFVALKIDVDFPPASKAGRRREVCGFQRLPPGTAVDRSGSRGMPSALIREARVVGFMPRSSAAPCGPKTFPLVCWRAVMML